MMFLNNSTAWAAWSRGQFCISPESTIPMPHIQADCKRTLLLLSFITLLLPPAYPLDSPYCIWFFNLVMFSLLVLEFTPSWPFLFLYSLFFPYNSLSSLLILRTGIQIQRYCGKASPRQKLQHTSVVYLMNNVAINVNSSPSYKCKLNLLKQCCVLSLATPVLFLISSAHSAASSTISQISWYLIPSTSTPMSSAQMSASFTNSSGMLASLTNKANLQPSTFVCMFSPKISVKSLSYLCSDNDAHQ